MLFNRELILWTPLAARGSGGASNETVVRSDGIAAVSVKFALLSYMHTLALELVVNLTDTTYLDGRIIFGMYSTSTTNKRRMFSMRLRNGSTCDEAKTTKFKPTLLKAFAVFEQTVPNHHFDYPFLPILIPATYAAGSIASKKKYMQIMCIRISEIN
ncbi:hypothetical protein PNOK_0102800 [Pyrrhoderma noxium]|uniref:Uncharacterized protein n=1 Tax=Pyrrhoderma noxium TaxID=2282107 RepID=A0A286UWH7_9AGAM|nr:hypothetical protein PNOK_0102800 [Pyrrhoderma noxium]